MFEKHGLRVRLSKEPGWATIRDKVLYGEIHAAHAIAGLAFSLAYGVGAPRTHCVTGFLFNSHGTAITLSNELIAAGVKDARSLGAYARTYRQNRPVTLAVVHPFSSHHLLMHTWLRKASIQLSQHLQLIVIPPPLVVRNLELGHIDGFFAGEPYNTIAEEKEIGQIATLSADLSPFHPEKALIVQKVFADHYEQEHLSLIRALQEACAYCDHEDNREELSNLLSGSRYLGISPATIPRSLSLAEKYAVAMHLYSRHGVNRPTKEKAVWLMDELERLELISSFQSEQGPKPTEIFREDIYDLALGETG